MSLYDGIKDVAKVAQQANNVELYKKILDLQKEALDLIEENKTLKEKLNEFNKIEEIEKKLEFKDSAYYIDNDGPYCSTCWDKDKKLIRMHYVSDTRYICNVCNTKIGDCPVTVLNFL